MNKKYIEPQILKITFEEEDIILGSKGMQSETATGKIHEVVTMPMDDFEP